MKRLLFVLVFVALLVSVNAAQPVAAQTVSETVAKLFAEHPDISCTKSFVINVKQSAITKLSVPIQAYNEQIVEYAKSVKMDVDFAQCYAWVWIYNRDVMASHYAQRGGITDADRTALYYNDTNEIIYQLGGMPAWRFILDNGRPAGGHWQKYPDRYLSFPD